MSCQERRDLLHGYLDGELDLAETLEMERHLQSCQSCERAYGNQRILRSAIRSSAPYYKAPARLRRRVRPAAWIAPMGIAAAIAVMLAGTWFALRPPPGRELIAQEVVSGHIRSLMAPQPIDVASSDRHTVKPWFNGRIPQSPRVIDLAQDGFPLLGGRVDVVGRTPVPSLVYGRRQHLISLTAVPDASVAIDRSQSARGYNVIAWTADGVTYWAVSDLSASELQTFARLFRDAPP